MQTCVVVATGSPAAGAAAWRPLGGAAEPALHPDLRTARKLVGVLNRAIWENKERTLAELSHLSVTTEYGLYTLVSLVCHRALAAPQEAALCAWTCKHLADLTVRVARHFGGG